MLNITMTCLLNIFLLFLNYCVFYFGMICMYRWNETLIGKKKSEVRKRIKARRKEERERKKKGNGGVVGVFLGRKKEGMSLSNEHLMLQHEILFSTLW